MTDMEIKGLKTLGDFVAASILDKDVTFHDVEPVVPGRPKEVISGRVIHVEITRHIDTSFRMLVWLRPDDGKLRTVIVTSLGAAMMIREKGGRGGKS